MNAVMRILGMALMSALLMVGAAQAQVSDAVAQKKDWSIFKQGSGADRMCWIVSQPLSSTAKRAGSPVSVNRGNIFLMVALRPGERVKNEVSMMAGYPFRKNSAVKVKIGSDTYEMFTEGEGAWTDSAESDDKLVGAMRRGSDAVISGVSSRGTTTTDTFSLRGFTAAINEARKLCK